MRLSPRVRDRSGPSRRSRPSPRSSSHLALRGRTVSLGYELGRAHAEQARLREVKRVLQVEAASYKTPERVEIVARTLLVDGAASHRRASFRSRAVARASRGSGHGVGRRRRVAMREPRPAARTLDPTAHGAPVRRDGAGARRLRLERLPRAGRGRRVLARDGGEAAAAAAPHRAEARHHLRPQRDRARGERRGAERERGRRGDAPWGRVGARPKPTSFDDAAARLGQALSLDPNELYARLATKHRFLWVKRRITSDEASAVRDLGDAKRQARPIHGLAIEGEGHRYYPGRELAGPVLGFVAPDGQGKDGIELALDDELRGHVEEVKGLRDRAGHLLFSDGTSDEEALEGHDVTLTMDEGIQHVAEQELDAAQKTYETKGASIVVARPEHRRGPRDRVAPRATTRTTTASRTSRRAATAPSRTASSPARP